jgi:catechol 2,3-dioxygenase-like lactoylglutathione lyase family enzyme
VARAAHFRAVVPDAPDVRVLVMELAAKGREAEAATNRAFFRNVLGSDVPELPKGIELSEGLRVQVWTYRIPDVAGTNERLRANGIPVVFDPADFTTAYLGDHKAMAIRAPDGTIVELVETAAP